MAFCGKCGKQVQDGATLCPACEKLGQTNLANDVEINKPMAILAYILFFIPLLTGDYKKSPFVKFHTNQGTVLIIATAVVSIISGITARIPFVGTLLFLVNIFVTVVPRVMGIINAVHGEMKPIPLVGNIKIFK